MFVMKATTLALFSVFAAANAESHAAAPIPVNADAPVTSRRLGINSDKIRDAIADAIAALADDKDLSALLDLELNFDFSPSEFLADKAREALDNIEEPSPKNWRERMRRAARDAAIESAILGMERAGKRQENLVKDFLKEVREEVNDFGVVQFEEWQEFIQANVQDVERFIHSPAVQELLEDPLRLISKEFWDEHGDHLRALLEDIEEAEEFVLERIADAKEFLKKTADDTRDIIEESFGFLTDTIETVLRVAERFGIQHSALDALQEFLEDPKESIKNAFQKLIQEKASDRENTLLPLERGLSPRSSCLKRGTPCSMYSCKWQCCGDWIPPLNLIGWGYRRMDQRLSWYGGYCL